MHSLHNTSPATADRWTETARAILAATNVRDGYAIVLGIDHGRLVEELAQQSNLHVIAVDEDASKVAAARKRLCALGLYGTRASVLVGNPLTYPFSPYLASLVVSETPDTLSQADDESLVSTVFHVLRPYGGVAVASGPLADRGRIEQITQDKAFAGARVRNTGDFVLLERSAPLPGAADWSHADANAAATGASEDTFIRSPMSILWFDAARRWHKFPGQDQVRVAGGRLVLFEEGILRASDVYTGRTLWEVDVPVGIKPVTDPRARDAVHYARHRQWGPKPSLPPTTQLVAVDDAIYLSAGTSCLVFDPATGKTRNSIELPESFNAPWANLRVSGDYLVGTSGTHVLCMQRHSGKVLWQTNTTRAELSLAVGRNKVFCAELTNPRRGENETCDGSMFALNLATGEQVWRRPGGARLRYSPSLDIVVTATGFFRGSDGEPLARKAGSPKTRLVVQGKGLPEPGLPGLIAGNKLLTGTEDTLQLYDLPTGEPIGKPLKWSRRGCTGTRASTHLLTIRYLGNSAWIDLESRKITPMLGIRPGCSVNNNLYPANGVLNIPNLTAGCTCNYAPVSMACVPTSVIQRSGNDQ